MLLWCAWLPPYSPTAVTAPDAVPHVLFDILMISACCTTQGAVCQGLRLASSSGALLRFLTVSQHTQSPWTCYCAAYLLLCCLLAGLSWQLACSKPFMCVPTGRDHAPLEHLRLPHICCRVLLLPHVSHCLSRCALTSHHILTLYVACHCNVSGRHVTQCSRAGVLPVFKRSSYSSRCSTACLLLLYSLPTLAACGCTALRAVFSVFHVHTRRLALFTAPMFTPG